MRTNQKNTLLGSSRNDAMPEPKPPSSGAQAEEADLLMAISEELATLEGGTAQSRHTDARRLLEEAFARVERRERGERPAA